MEEGEQGKGWLKWVIIVPVAMAAGMLLTKWVMQPGKARPAAAPEKQAEAVFPPAAPEAPKPAAGDSSGFDLPGDEPAGGEAGIIWANKPAAAPREGARPASSTAPAADPRNAKKDRGLGFAYGALTKAAEKLLGNPGALAALLNNDYVVKGFMSRDTVKNATANSAALANYLKNPENMNKFMGKEAVQRGINNPQLVNAVATSKLAAALMDTPAGKALLNDPMSIADIIKANPGIIGVLTTPTVLNALIQNPKTAGLTTQLAGGGPAR